MMCHGFPLLIMLLHVVTAIHCWPSSDVYCFIFTMHMVIISIGFKHECWKTESICWTLKPGDQSYKNISNIDDIKGDFNGKFIIKNGENSSQPCFFFAGGYHSSIRKSKARSWRSCNLWSSTPMMRSSPEGMCRFYVAWQIPAEKNQRALSHMLHVWNIYLTFALNITQSCR